MAQSVLRLATLPGLTQDMLNQATAVFSGEFTVESDKERLVDTCLGLWAIAHVQREQPHMRTIYELISAHKARVFPKEYFDDLIPLLEQQIGETPGTAAEAHKLAAGVRVQHITRGLGSVTEQMEDGRTRVPGSE